MSRWRAFAGRHLRWSSSITQGLILCVVTFGMILPLCCHHLLYSYYFLKFIYLDHMSEMALQVSHERGQKALEFWENLDTTQALDVPMATVQDRPELLVTVVTTRRKEGWDFHYLLQVMQQLVSLLKRCGERPCAEVMVCDIESGPLHNEDASLLEKQFLVVRKTLEEQRESRGSLNIFEKEKRDYVYCLRKGWELMRPKNVVILEDDALPRADFFAVIQNLLSRRFAMDSLYIKLYHPERLQRYWNPEPYRILEWVGLGFVGATVLLLTISYRTPLAFSLSAPHLLFLTLYVMAVVELIGRHYLLELRRVSPQLYAVSPATECCTPAMLYPGNASLRVAEYLDRVSCAKGSAKDTVLYHIARSTPGERAHSVEPNLITHIGAFSSVRANPARPKLI
ncbi:post-GPI attachment to proteins factor 4 [Chanos chanos]|uniref:Post-GPI attachment to proteins factor 4 n=1 Tax=Chanos chanos TaxID=29144 RepID=A0A6J2V953_CHACN|nr:transmembrane protein 246 [Chanos chanos]